MTTLGVTFALAGVSMGGGKKSQQQGPPMNATSKEEEAFITYVFFFGARPFFDVRRSFVALGRLVVAWRCHRILSCGWAWAGLTVVLCAGSS